MNRIIKFRAWNKKDKFMYLWETLIGAKQKWIWKWLEANKDESENIIMQFTGLLDKNGKEIYEGDIVQHIKIDKGWTLDREYKVNEVIECHGYNKWTFLWAYYKYEIIGNIHSSPELMEGGE